jgi:hypothetical protein
MPSSPKHVPPLPRDDAQFAGFNPHRQTQHMQVNDRNGKQGLYNEDHETGNGRGLTRFSWPRRFPSYKHSKHVSMPVNICKLRSGGGVQQNAVGSDA